MADAGTPPPLDGGVADPLETRYSPASPVAMPNSVMLRSSYTSVIMEIRRKILTLACRLSMSLDVIGTDTDRSATYDFLLVIRSIVCSGL